MNMDNHHQYDSSMADLCKQFISPEAEMFNFPPGGQHDEYHEMMNIPLSGDHANNMTAHVMNNSLDAEAGFFNIGGAGTGRWPRQETLTLLEVRSRLHSKFKESNQKGPLWDEISRIMSDEHGYQRSGKKCREKFENLYKYYKKTKDGKAGRQDGKHYRFFRQLEALYGETSNSNTPLASLQENQFVSNSTTQTFQTANNLTSTPTYHEAMQPHTQWDSLSLSSSFGMESSSSDDNDLSTSSVKRRGPRKWRAKIKDFIDTQMRKLMEKQETYFEKVMKTLEQKEQERLTREEEWKKQETARLEREHKFWAKERAWIEARDAALMEALHSFTGRDQLNGMTSNSEDNQHENGSDQTLHNNNTSNEQRWSDTEITRLLELRTGMESRIQQSGFSENLLWEEISTRMACLGYDKNPIMCKEKWDGICNDYTRRSRNESNNKKRKENLRNYSYFQNDNSMYTHAGVYTEIGEQRHDDITRLQQINDGSSPLSCNVGNVIPDNCLRFLMGDGENLWENYGGLKLNKLGEN